jgi:hypothetical protein
MAILLKSARSVLKTTIPSRGKNNCLFYTTSRPALGLIQSPTQRVLEAGFSEVEQQGRETVNSPSSSAEVKNGGSMPLLPYVPSQRAA